VGSAVHQRLQRLGSGRSLRRTRRRRARRRGAAHRLANRRTVDARGDRHDRRRSPGRCRCRDHRAVGQPDWCRHPRQLQLRPHSARPADRGAHSRRLGSVRNAVRAGVRRHLDGPRRRSSRTACHRPLRPHPRRVGGVRRNRCVHDHLRDHVGCHPVGGREQRGNDGVRVRRAQRPEPRHRLRAGRVPER
jgi:hypothetical protein